jgi:hypothetical protein
VKRTLLNCDQVFDVLTRGPFPAGEPEDDAVERHLRACHECRRLAEALRPAVALLHEAVSSDEAIDLPEYQGALPWARSERRQRLSIARLARCDARKASHLETPRPHLLPRGSRAVSVVTALRVVAASLLVFAFGSLMFAIAWAPNGRWPAADGNAGILASRGSDDIQRAVPTANGLLTLASLKLPAACVPVTHRPATPEQAGEIAASLENGSLAGLKCCTQCHHAGTPQPKAARLVALAQQNCQACHRG